MTIEEKKQFLGKVFSPTAPIKEEIFFRGRITQLKRIVEVMNEDGQHAILFGERGVGKTSMANISTKHITNLYSVKITCNSDDDFKKLWTRALNEVQFTKTIKGIGFDPTVQKSIISLGQNIGKEDEVFPHTVYNTLRQFPNNTFLFIFDEFDNIKNQQTRVQFADLIKSLSDNSINIKIMIVGIAENVINLIGNHKSLERCLMQIRMPKMSTTELTEIITKGIEQLEVTMDGTVVKKIIDFSAGFPHYTHLLGKYSIRIALDRGVSHVSGKDLELAISKALENATEQLTDVYKIAVLSTTKDTQWKQVLFACASCKCDEFDSFSINDILEKFNEITGSNSTTEKITVNIGKFCQEERGLILEKIGVGNNNRYKFYNSMMKPFVLLKMEKDV